MSMEALVSKLSFVGGRTKKGGHRGLAEPQVHGQLASMMRKMTKHGVGDRGVARIVAHNMAADHKSPRSHQMLVVRIL